MIRDDACDRGSDETLTHHLSLPWKSKSYPVAG